MKILVIFIGLKIVETVGLCAVLILMALFGKLLSLTRPDILTFSGFGEYLLVGFGSLVIILSISCLICALISLNWKWAERLGGKK
uniref:Uncharacterized protein n=1 Tax=viral metagenome TaxID=1070528 RepID=A0A6H2A1D6_9ZZZZ